MNKIGCRSRAALLLAITLMISLTSFGSVICANFAIENGAAKNLYQSELSQQIHAFRRSKVHEESGEIVVNKKSYQTIGVLGSSSSTVYLARAKNGQLVSIKFIESNKDSDPWAHATSDFLDGGGWADSVYYEAAATQFYLEKGVAVPRVIDFEVSKKNGQTQSAILVKEYREGILMSELEKLIKTEPRKWNRYSWILKQLPAERDRIQKLHTEFDSWLKKKKINLDHLNIAFLGSLIEYGDLTQHNFIFDAETHRWIPFDF